MKVIHDKDDRKRLTKQDLERIAILKLTDDGKYIEGVGIKDKEYFLLVESDHDDTYLASYYFNMKGSSRLTRDKLVEAVLMIAIAQNVDDQKEAIDVRLQKKRKVGKSAGR